MHMGFYSQKFSPKNIGDQVDSEGIQTPLAYRYVVCPNANIHCYKPKELGEDVDHKACRSTQLGAHWCGRFQKLPRSAHCDLVWEVPWAYHNKLFADVFADGFFGQRSPKTS